jgi:hypothetical protein
MRSSDSICRECGSPFSATRSTREFCGSYCRAKFHNRQARRGAQLYGLIMALRFDRVAAKETKALSIMGRMAAAFRAEDIRDRSGRRSWDLAKAGDARFRATVIGTAGARRKKS